MRILVVAFFLMISTSSYSSWFEDIGCDDSERLKSKSSRNDPEILFKLGFGYSSGCKSYEKDAEKGRQYYIRAAKMDYGLAQLNLGIMYMDSYSGYLDFGKALRWLRIAELNGMSQADQYINDIYRTIEKVEPAVSTTEGKYKIAQSIRNNKKDFYFREDLLLRLSREYESEKNYDLLSKVQLSLGTMNFSLLSFVQDSEEEFGKYAVNVNAAEKYYKASLDASKASNDIFLRLDPLLSLSIFYRSKSDLENECKMLSELYSIYQANSNFVGNGYPIMRPDSIERYKSECVRSFTKI